MPTRVDPVALAAELIRCPSVTPADAGALDVLQATLGQLGFECVRLPFQAEGTARIDNLYARVGTGAPHFCFAGHTDVVPIGDTAAWTVDPFGGAVIDGRLFGRGAADMKGGIAAFVAAAERVIAAGGVRQGSVSLLITGDEEGPAVNGTRPMLEWLADRGETLDACLVGEPTSARVLGDTVKIGRRGSVNFKLTALGAQGHSAYPERADNPLPRLAHALHLLTRHPLDEGTKHFPASTLALTSIDVGNPATNVIPARGTARFNVRFNDLHTGASLTRHVEDVLEEVGGRWEVEAAVSGEAFLTPPGVLSSIVSDAIQSRLGRVPALNTTGGTSDARFIRRFCPVVEFGLVGASMHKVDEHVAVDDLLALVDVYADILDRFFAGGRT